MKQHLSLFIFFALAIPAGAELTDQQKGERLFSISADALLKGLRRHLTLSGVPEAHKYGLKGFRHGCAMDMALAGRPLYEILQAGEWRSAAVKEYLDRKELEPLAFLNVVENHSDDDD